MTFLISSRCVRGVFSLDMERNLRGGKSCLYAVTLGLSLKTCAALTRLEFLLSPFLGPPPPPCRGVTSVSRPSPTLRGTWGLLSGVLRPASGFSVQGNSSHLPQRQSPPAICPPPAVLPILTKKGTEGPPGRGCWVIKNPSYNAGTRVWSLAPEDPTCRGATKPVRHSYWVWESLSCHFWVYLLQPLLRPEHPQAHWSPHTLRPMLGNKGSHTIRRLSATTGE